MLKNRLVRNQDAKLNFEVMKWLIKTQGAPSRPKIPSLLKTSKGLETLAWNESTAPSIFTWAERHFDQIKADCHMDDWSIDLVPRGDDLDTDQLAATRRLDALVAGHNPYTDKAKFDVFYDPRDSVEPGLFSAQTILQLAKIRTLNFESEQGLSPLMKRMVTVIAATYGRQGFTLAYLPHEVSKFLTAQNDLRAVPQRTVLNALCFATCLGLRIRRQSAEQIIATYGTRMPRAFRRKVKQACRQIDSHVEELAILQLLGDPPPRRMRLSQTSTKQA